MATNFQIESGRVTTLPAGFYRYEGRTIPTYSERNGKRFPMFHRLDLILNYELKNDISKYAHTFSLGIYNVYNRLNPLSYNFNRFSLDRSESFSSVEVNTLFGFLPFFNYTLRLSDNR